MIEQVMLGKVDTLIIRDRLAEAREMLKQAASLNTGSKFSSTVADEIDSHNHIATILLYADWLKNRGELEGADGLLSQGLKLANERRENSMIEQVMLGKVDTLIIRDRLAEAREMLKQAASLNTGSKFSSTRGRIALEDGNAAEARTVANEWLERTNRYFKTELTCPTPTIHCHPLA